MSQRPSLVAHSAGGQRQQPTMDGFSGSLEARGSWPWPINPRRDKCPGWREGRDEVAGEAEGLAFCRKM